MIQSSPRPKLFNQQPEHGGGMALQGPALPMVFNRRGPFHLVRTVTQLAGKPTLSSYINFPLQGPSPQPFSQVQI